MGAMTAETTTSTAASSSNAPATRTEEAREANTKATAAATAGAAATAEATAEDMEVQLCKARRAPNALSNAEIEQHEASEHAVYRSWCKHCVNARGEGEQHRTQVLDPTDSEVQIPTVSADYGYMHDEFKGEGSMPMLVLRDRTTRRYGASFVEKKGEDPYALRLDWLVT